MSRGLAIAHTMTDVRTLLFCQLVLGAIIAFGPTINDPNRIAGLAGTAVSMVISAAVIFASDRREVKLGLLAIVATAITLLAYRNADPVGIRSPLAEIGVPLMAADTADRLLPRHLLGLAAGPPALFLAGLAWHRPHPLWLRSVWLLSAALGVAAIGFSDSRDAWIAAVAGGAALMCSAFVARRCAVLLFAASISAAAGLATLVSFGEDVSLQGREQLWVIGLRHVAANPLFGLGYGGLSDLYRQETPGAGTNAHSLVVQVLGDFGAIGLIVLALTVVDSVRSAISDERLSRAAFGGFFGCLVFVLVAGMAESIIDATQQYPGTDVTIVLPLLFVVLAIPLRRGALTKSESTDGSRATQRKTRDRRPPS